MGRKLSIGALILLMFVPEAVLFVLAGLLVGWPVTITVAVLLSLVCAGTYFIARRRPAVSHVCLRDA